MKRARLLSFREAEGRSDEEVMWAVVTDVSELSLLFDRHHRALFNFFFRDTGNRSVSEDLVQDVFFRILKYRASYQKGVPFRRWMYRIAINASRDQRRRASRSETSLEEFPAEPAGPGPAPEEALSHRQELARLREALGLLPEEKREVLLLSRFSNLKYEEIGEILGVSSGAVKLRVHRALRELKGLFTQASGRKRHEV